MADVGKAFRGRAAQSAVLLLRSRRPLLPGLWSGDCAKVSLLHARPQHGHRLGSSEEEPHIVGTRESGYSSCCYLMYSVPDTAWFVTAVSTVLGGFSGLLSFAPLTTMHDRPAEGDGLHLWLLFCAVTVGWRDGLPTAGIGAVGRTETARPLITSSIPTQSTPTQYAGNIGAQPRDGMRGRRLSEVAVRARRSAHRPCYMDVEYTVYLYRQTLDVHRQRTHAHFSHHCSQSGLLSCLLP